MLQFFLWVAMGALEVPSVQQGGVQGIYQSNAIQSIERSLYSYLNAELIKSILTPGESVEWKLDLKAGQIVIAEADSGSFDPALEILDSKGVSVAKNDDRYPGDQRPLLFWRCHADGAYLLHVRSYKNNAGGQVYTRFQIFESLDVPGGGMVEGVFDATKPFFVRVPMTAGQVKDMVAEKRGEGNYLTFNFSTVVFPNGIPEWAPSVSETVSPAIHGIVAPVAGDYYVLTTPYGYVGGAGRVRIGTREFVPAKLTAVGASSSGTAKSGVPALWELAVKTGDLLEVFVSDLNLNSILKISEAPNFSKYDVSKAETNPFFPPLRNQPPDLGPAFDMLPGRARDSRVAVFRARRDATLWLATDGVAPTQRPFTLSVKPAAAALVEGKPNAGKLKVAKFDYWAFEANAGDVMSFSCRPTGFSPVVVVRDPDLGEIRHADLPLDISSDEWRLVFQKPGRYLIQLSCIGDGGGGDYSLTSTTYHAKEITKETPAQSEISPGEVQIWKFSVKPESPLYMHWKSQGNYSIAVFDDKGRPNDFQRTKIDDSNYFGIIKVNEPTTFLIVLTGAEAKGNYKIELSDLPGYKGG